jgi:hypothetical protein
MGKASDGDVISGHIPSLDEGIRGRACRRAATQDASAAISHAAREIPVRIFSGEGGVLLFHRNTYPTAVVPQGRPHRNRLAGTPRPRLVPSRRRPNGVDLVLPTELQEASSDREKTPPHRSNIRSSEELWASLPRDQQRMERGFAPFAERKATKVTKSTPRVSSPARHLGAPDFLD